MNENDEVNKSSSSSTREGQEGFEEWIQSLSTIKKWSEQYDLEKQLAENDDFLVIDNFFPEFVAEGALEAIKTIPDEEWEVSESADEYNDVSHSFWSNDSYGNIPDITRAFMFFVPGKLPTMSAAKYVKSGHIAPHDDKMLVPVGMADGEAEWHSRDIALIYYLTKDWKDEFGGQLVDKKTGKSYTPKFNRCIIFRVPRVHEVTPVTADLPRYSFFGWWLEEGILYDPDAPNGLIECPEAENTGSSEDNESTSSSSQKQNKRQKTELK